MTRPHYNLPTETKALYCSIHKKENMINIKDKRCIETNCMIIPNYNLPTETKALYCSVHKKDNMIDIKHKPCIETNCMTLPTYNLPTEKTALYCSIHKKENMIDIKNKRCIENNCMTRPIYNLPTETKALYCSVHKKENMINIKDKRCIETNCMTRPIYNLPTETKALYCFEHKKENMISIQNNKCQSSKCKETPLFGLPNKRIQYCLHHKQENMINLVLENKCSILECNEEYNHIIETTKYCNTHIPENSLMIVKRFCKYCDIKEDATFVCKDCKKIQNKKEWAIVRYLRKAIDTQFEYNSSKMLQGCSKKRPDVYFELLKHCIIVECDENQHTNYGDSCECARLNEIVNGIGGKSVIIIRYNPDIVKNKGKILTIKNADRIDLLVKTIKDELVKEYDTFIVKTIQLYYNDNYNTYQPFKEENITDLVCI
jgi:hypothetical protein